MAHYFSKSLKSLMAIVICVLPLLAFEDSARAAPDYRFHPQVISLLTELKDILIKHQLCATRDRCSSAEIVFASSEPWGTAVEIYGIVDKAVLQELATIAMAAFFRSNTPMSVKLEIYSITKAQAIDAPIFRKPKPTMKLSWEDRNANR